MTVTLTFLRARASRLFIAFISACAAILLSAQISHAAPMTPPLGQCHNMLIVKVVDGDTVYGYIDTSDPVVAVRVNLRLSGIDAPERKGRAKCRAERRKGEEAREYLSSILNRAIESRSRLLARVCHMKRAKYATRRLGRLEVRLRNGWVDMNELLLRKGYAFPYQGGRRGRTWCNCLEKGECPAGYNERDARLRAEGTRGKRG